MVWLKSSLKWLSVAVVISVLFPSDLMVLAKPKKPTGNAGARQQTVTPSQPQDPYQKAKQDLPENYYLVYRIVERIARANGLDDSPWRIIVTDQYNVNAYASEYNLLTFEAGIIDQLEGNSSALACVIGHEMGHHTRQHLGYGPAQKVEAAAQAEIEAEEAKLSARKDIQDRAVVGNALQGGGGLLGGIGGSVVGTVGAGVSESSRQATQNLPETDKQIDQETQAKINQRIIAINHRQEFEGDELGYIYSVKAGFEPEGCLKVMEILGRGHGSQGASETHPTPEVRTEKLKELMQKSPSEQLAQEGKAKLDTSTTPLSYETFTQNLAEGGTLSGLKLKPRTGSSHDDLERLIGK